MIWFPTFTCGYFRRRIPFTSILVLLHLALQCSSGADSPSHSPQKASAARPSPLSPDQALAAFEVDENLSLELVAAEPTVADPVALAFDEFGRMYVAENRGYPTGPGEAKPPAGIIALLEDTDGDGVYEKRTVFVDGLTFPNGVLPWKRGLIVTCAPEILYLRDTDGDGRADERRILLTGFSTKGSTQLRVSHPTLAPDGWIYVTSGLTGGKITAPDFPGRGPVEIGRTDLRFRPDTGEIEAADGGSQFGLTFDDFGHRFICYNRVQAQHVVLSSRYLKRNPNLAFSETVQNLPEEMLPEPLKGHGAAARVFPISTNVTTADSHAGTFTAACGVLVYRGTALPQEYYGAIFSCEPTGNLVHYDRLIPHGATFLARRARDGVEFLASRDEWFRPVFLANAPDGALYICDMYRKTIEHPEYLPEEVRKRTDFESGKGLGRIWRVRGPGSKTEVQSAKFRVQSPKFAAANSETLVAALDHPNGWHRDTAFRLLVEGHETSAILLLQNALRSPSSAASGVAKLRALAVLDGLDDEFLAYALASEHAAVRETAIILAESRLAKSEKLRSILLNLAADSDAHVRFHCALALGEGGFPKDEEYNVPPSERPADDFANALGRIAVQDAGDRWTRAAILSSSHGHAEALLNALEQPPASNNVEGISALLSSLGHVLASYPPRFGPYRRALTAAHWNFDLKASFLAGYADGLRDKGLTSTEFSPLWFLNNASSDSTSGERLKDLFDHASRVAPHNAESINRRVRAVSLLAHADAKQVNAALLPLLDSPHPGELQTATIRAVAQPHNVGAAAQLLVPGRWKNYTPAVRSAVLSTLLTRAQFLGGLLDAIEFGAVPASALDSSQRNQLLKHKDDAIGQRATRLFKNPAPADRMKAYEASKSVLSLPADGANGRRIFERACANCHRLDRVGVAVGPDLFSIRNQSKEAILLHTIIPEYEVMPAFANYEIATRDGRTLAGLIVAETSTSLTLRRALGEEESVLRSNIASISASHLSLMPQELEKTMTGQELADLVAYLKGENADGK